MVSIVTNINVGKIRKLDKIIIYEKKQENEYIINYEIEYTKGKHKKFFKFKFLNFQLIISWNIFCFYQNGKLVKVK